MDPQFQAYLAWQEERGFIWPTPKAPSTGPTDENHGVTVVCSATSEDDALLEKMLSAIQINQASIVTEEHATAPLQLVFSPPPAGQRLGTPITTGGTTKFYTYHPSTLRNVPELKPLAWSQLQAFKSLLDQTGGLH